MFNYSENRRPRRSVLFMPSSNRRALAKAPGFDCDGLIFDLEDSVSPQKQGEARGNLLELVRGQDFGGKETVIRVSAPQSEDFSLDITTAIECSPDAILLPKVETGGAISDLAVMLEYSGAGDIQIWAMIETPRALVNLGEITSSGGKLTCLVVGCNDLAKFTGVPMVRGRQTMVPWLMDVVAHGRANDLCILDSVLNNFKDDDWLKEECEQGASMGFDGKTLIHPAQIEAANRAFSPSETEILRAREIVDLFAGGDGQAIGAVQLDGEMIEYLHYENAKSLLALAERLNGKATKP